MSRKGCEAAPAILVGAQILGLLRNPFAAQGRSYTDRVDGIDMGMGELCGRSYGFVQARSPQLSTVSQRVGYNQ